jgi:hypothetical protein
MFYSQFLCEVHEELMVRFISDPVFEEWNQLCVSSFRKARNAEEQYELLAIGELLWTTQTEAFEKSEFGMPPAFIAFLKGVYASNEVVFIESARVMFTLTVHLGI